MEQKTEASQAVDEQVFLTIVYQVPRKHANELAAECGDSAHFSAASWSHALDERDAARVALKAQPAPTEAPITFQDVQHAAMLAWSVALDSAAFYVAGHCARGESHAEKILEMQMPAIKLRSEEIATEAQGNYCKKCSSPNSNFDAHGDAVIPASVDLHQMQDETEAQGEDSARLDDLTTIRELDRIGMELGAKLVQMVGHLDNGIEYLPRDAIMMAVTDWRSAWSKNSKARKPIYRARASAETGGVKS